MIITESTTIKDLAISSPQATRVFEKFGIDYCCGGGRTLLEACQEADLSFDDVVHLLEREELAAGNSKPARDWQSESPADLAAFIIDKHHFFTKQELGRLETLLDKVCSRHSTNHPQLNDVEGIFRQLKQDLVPHMYKEEEILFPYIAQMEEAISEGRSIPQAPFGTVQNPVRMMMMEHDTAGDLLKELRHVTNGYALPEDACNSYRTLYLSLEAFEADLHQHIHLENNILFPRAVEMEQGR